MSAPSLAVSRCRTRLLGPAGPGARDRVERAHRRLDRPLSDALVRQGIAPESLVCIRSLRVALRDGPDLDADGLAEAIADALARSIVVGIARGEIVVYHSERDAALDLIRSLRTGDASRRWAWTQAGLPVSPGNTPAAAIALWLARQPREIVPTLVTLADDRAAFAAFAAAVAEPEGAGWPALARAAVGAAGGEEERLFEGAERQDERGLGERALREEMRGAEGVPMEMRARRLLSRSAIAGAAPSASSERGIPPVALAALVLAEVDPGVLSAAFAPDLLRIAAALLSDPARARARLREGNSRAVETGECASERGNGSLPHELPGAPSSTDLPEASRRSAPSPRPAPPPAARPDPSHAAQHSDVAVLPPPILADAEGWTEHGGLLYLLNLLDESEAIEAAHLPPLAARSLRWTLHAVAGALLPDVPADDPARLAFCGLPPDVEPPSAGEPTAARREVAAVKRIAAALGVAAARRLGRPHRAGPAVVRALAARRARIVGRPGWIEVHLSLDDVSIDVRREGLDLDPGFVRALGAVVRFRYG